MPPVLPKDQQRLMAEGREEKRKPPQKQCADFIVKVHKRKGAKGAVHLSYAVVDTKESKQIVQLTSSARDDAQEIVDNVVASLNEGSVTKDDAIHAINAAKPGQQKAD